MKEKIYDIIAEQLGMYVNEITEDASFVDNLGADSLDLVEMIMAFEEEFNVEISDDAADKIKTVGDALEYVKELM